MPEETGYEVEHDRQIGLRQLLHSTIYVHGAAMADCIQICVAAGI